MERDSFIFYRSFWEALRQCPDDVRLQLYDAIADFALNFQKPSSLDGVAAIVFPLIEPQIAANNKRYINGLKGKDFGIKGGAPKGNKNAKKSTPKEEQINPKKQPKQPQINPKSTPNENENENENENVNVNENEDALHPITPARKMFQKPTIKEVEDYITERGYIFDASAFWNFYESNGWKVGKNPMKNWKAACSTWNVKEKQFQSKDKRNGSNNDHPTNEQLIKQTYELINESAARAEAGYYDDTRLPF